MCERCAENHYGNPLVVNGTCTSCLEGCNYNIDMQIPGSCDPFDGKCLKCEFNTAGDSCELCASGYYGDATQHSCIGKYYALPNLHVDRSESSPVE